MKCNHPYPISHRTFDELKGEIVIRHIYCSKCKKESLMKIPLKKFGRNVERIKAEIQNN